jgi:hypothetical protein
VHDLPHDREVFEAPIATPEGFDAGLAITASAEKATQLGDPVHSGAQIHRRPRRIGSTRVGGIQRGPLGRPQDGGAGLVRLFPGPVRQLQQAPSDEAIHGQRSVHAVEGFAREVLDRAPALQDTMIAFDAPAIGTTVSAGVRSSPARWSAASIPGAACPAGAAPPAPTRP